MGYSDYAAKVRNLFGYNSWATDVMGINLYWWAGRNEAYYVSRQPNKLLNRP